MIERRASRILLVDALGRTLLFRYREGVGFVWVPPGGGLEAGEDHLDAARREILEETGREIPVGGPIGRLVRHYTRGDGRLVRQHEVWYAARTEPFALDPALLDGLRAEGVLDGRWFRAPGAGDPFGAELLVLPRLAALIADVLAGDIAPDRELDRCYGPPAGPR